MDRRTDVVLEPGKRQLLGPASAADRRLLLEEQDRQPGLGQDDSRGQTIGARADDNSVKSGHWRRIVSM